MFVQKTISQELWKFLISMEILETNVGNTFQTAADVLRSNSITRGRTVWDVFWNDIEGQLNIPPKISQTAAWGSSWTKKDLFYMYTISVRNNSNTTGIGGYVGVESF